MKNDIRTSRKVGPLNGTQSTATYGTRRNKFRKPSSLDSETQSDTRNTVNASKTNISTRVGRHIKSDHHTKERNSDTILEVDTETCVVFKENHKNESVDRKRRRPSAQSYINKRFLYDVAEPVRRTRHEGNLQSRARSTAELMAVSSANLLRRNRPRPGHELFPVTGVDDPSKSRSRRGRPLKRRLNTDSIKGIADDLVYRSRSRGKTNIKQDDHKDIDAEVVNTQVNWNAHDLFNVSATHGITDYQLSDAQPITSLQKYPDPGGMTAYSDALLNAFDDTHSPGQALLAEEHDDAVLRIRVGGVSCSAAASRGGSGAADDVAYRPASDDLDVILRSRHQAGARRHLAAGDTYLSHGQDVYPPQRHRSSPTVNPPTDILAGLYSDVHPGCFPSQQLHVPVDGGPDDADDELDDVLGSPDYLAPTGRLHHHHRYPLPSGHAAALHDLAGVPSPAAEEVEEEEDLLSPELSILAGSAVAGTGTSGGLLERADCEAGQAGLFVPQGLGGSGSRRKSPVRPMQVIRTKSHTAPATASVGQQSPPLGSGSGGGHLEPSSLILTSSVLHGGGASVYSRRRLSGEHDYPGDSSRDLSGGGAAASVIRLLPGHAPVVQTFPAVGNSARLLGCTATSPAAAAEAPADDCGLIVSVTSSGAVRSSTSSYLSGGAHSSRLLLSAGATGSLRPPPVSTTATSSVATPNTSSAGANSRTSLLSTSPSASSAVAARRRPTILKRGPPVASGGAGLLRQTAVPDGVDLPTGHQAGPASDHHQQQQRSPVSSSSTAPTKLLQLVTAPLPTSHLPTSTSSSSSGVSAVSTSSSMTASDRLFGRRAPPPSSLLSGHSNKSAGGADLVDVARNSAPGGKHNNTFSSNTPYRYAVVRGSADGKRYLVLGSHGVFDRNLASGSTADSSPPPPSDFLANETAATGLGQQIIPLDSFPMHSGNSPAVSGHLTDEGLHRAAAVGPALIRRGKGSSPLASLVVTALPAASGDSVVVT